MASELVRGCDEQPIDNQPIQVRYGDQNLEVPNLSSQTFTMLSRESNNLEETGSISSYTLASDDSRYQDETRRCSGTEDTGVQNSRALVQRATLAPSASLDSTGMMYILALILPLIGINTGDIQWRCTPSAVLNSTEFLLIHLSRVIGRIRTYIRQLAHDQIARDLFATAMDIVLVVYAIGFLFLSLYQASIFA